MGSELENGQLQLHAPQPCPHPQQMPRVHLDVEGAVVVVEVVELVARQLLGIIHGPSLVVHLAPGRRRKWGGRRGGSVRLRWLNTEKTQRNANRAGGGTGETLSLCCALPPSCDCRASLGLAHSLVCVAEDGIHLLQRLELVLGAGVVGVLVGVQLQRQLVEGLADVGLQGGRQRSSWGVIAGGRALRASMALPSAASAGATARA